MFRALMNARPSHLCDPSIFDFTGLSLTGAPDTQDFSQIIPNLRQSD
jgi:tRNA 2-thiocytidine biosynthesis protein TtcA